MPVWPWSHSWRPGPPKIRGADHTQEALEVNAAVRRTCKFQCQGVPDSQVKPDRAPGHGEEIALLLLRQVRARSAEARGRARRRPHLRRMRRDLHANHER